MAQEAQTVLQKRMPLEMRDRLVGPDYLCFLTSGGGIELSKVADWKSQSKNVTMQNGKREAESAAGTPIIHRRPYESRAHRRLSP